MKNNEVLNKIINDKEDKLVNVYLRKYINGFKSSDIKRLEIDCVRCDVNYRKVMNKIIDSAYNNQ